MSIGDSHRTVGVLPRFGDVDLEKIEMVRVRETEIRNKMLTIYRNCRSSFARIDLSPQSIQS
jgi:hypothetical protein